MFLHLDCRHYLGDRPCKFKRLCEGCADYEPMGPRVLIIKLGALGDVVRTHALLPGLRKLTEDPPWVVWLTSPAAVPLVERMPGVDQVLAYNEESLHRLRTEKFDYVISLDKEPGPCAVAVGVQAKVRLGVGLSRYGTVYPLNDDANYYFELGLSDEEKFFRNKKSYQQLLYEAIGLRYEGEQYQLELTDADRAAAERKFAEFGASDVRHWIGLNPGAGAVFAYKAWREEGYAELIRELHRARPDAACVLLGGKEEAELLTRIERSVGDVPLYHAGTGNSLGEFTALVDRCDALVCGDTLAMHLGVARGRSVVAIFGPTCAQEIDVFGRGEKIVTPIDCAPCYRRTCDKNPTCQDQIPTAQVLEATLRQIPQHEAAPAATDSG